MKNIEDRIKVISLVKEGLCSSLQGAMALGISQRHVQRLARANNILPKPRNHWNKKPDRLKNLIVALKKERVERSNYCIADLLKERGYKACPATVRKILIENNCHFSKETERRSFKMFEAKKGGQIVQMDTTEGCWLKGYKIVKLVMAIDDYSRAILAFRWVEEDNTWNNMLVLRDIALKHGIPKMVYTDNDSKFRTIRHGSIYFKYHKEEYMTEIHKALSELGVMLLNHPPYHAFCKGKIERLFQFIQKRFIPEIKSITLEELNEEFAKWVKWYNSKHINRITGIEPKERLKNHCFKPLSGKEDLDWIFSLKESRKIDKYNSFTLNGNRYFLKNQCLVGQRAELALNPTRKIRVYSEGKFIQELKIKNN